MKHHANYRLSDSAPLYGCAILAGVIIAAVVVITLIYGALHGVSPL